MMRPIGPVLLIVSISMTDTMTAMAITMTTSLRSNERKPDTVGMMFDTSFATNAMAQSMPIVATVLALMRRVLGFAMVSSGVL